MSKNVKMLFNQHLMINHYDLLPFVYTTSIGSYQNITVGF